LAALQRIDPANGDVEVGNIHFAPSLRHGVAATEAMYLMMRYVFDDLGYRRYEWKCDSLNEKSRAAAERLGFRFEGVFRQAVVYKGRSRDTAWHAILDGEWPALKARFERWLAPGNFDENGHQRQRLQDA
jgi:RimJ/RimL family protein N-acetyltransferase